MYKASKAGVLPPSATPVVGGIQLPPGKLVAPHPDYATGPEKAPVLWITEDEPEDVPALWERLARAFPSTGLWPLILSSLDGDEERPWLGGELDSPSPIDGGPDQAGLILSARWGNAVPEEDEEPEELRPFGRKFPGLAAASPANPVDREAPSDVASTMDGRLGLVSVLRPADCRAVLGWMGPVNTHDDMGAFSAVLRSWEDRYGAYLVGLGFDTASLGVQRPPTDLSLATHIAAEHLAFCSDNIYQGSGSLAAYAKELVGSPLWAFWWD